MMHLSPKQKRGLFAEQWVYEELTARGYDVTMPPDFQRECCDLIVNGQTPVEVKWSAQNSRKRRNKAGDWLTYPKWSWDTGKICQDEGLLILIAEDNLNIRYPYIMPMSLMHGRSSFEINSHPTAYRGVIKPFLDNWDVVKLVTGQEYKNPDQLDLFHLSLTGEITYSEAVSNA